MNCLNAVFSVVFIALSTLAGAQDSFWHVSSLGTTLTSGIRIDDTTALMLGTSGTLLVTEDRGKTFVLADGIPNLQFHSAAFADGTLLLLSKNGRIMRSTDRAVSFEWLNPVKNMPFMQRCVALGGAQYLFLDGYGQAYRYTENDSVVYAVATPPNHGILCAVRTPSGQLLAASRKGVLRSSDVGKTWSVVLGFTDSVFGNPENMYLQASGRINVQMFDAEHRRHFLWYSDSDGVSWSRTPIVDGNGPLIWNGTLRYSFLDRDKQAVFHVDYSTSPAIVAKSSMDTSWNTWSTPLDGDTSVSEVLAFDSTTSLVFGGRKVMYRSTDRGVFYKLISNFSRDIDYAEIENWGLDIVGFANLNRLAYLVSTTDGGATWKHMPKGVYDVAYKITRSGFRYFSPACMVALYEDGTIAVSRDSGHTFQRWSEKGRLDPRDPMYGVLNSNLSDVSRMDTMIIKLSNLGRYAIVTDSCRKWDVVKNFEGAECIFDAQNHDTILIFRDYDRMVRLGSSIYLRMYINTFSWKTQEDKYEYYILRSNDYLKTFDTLYTRKDGTCDFQVRGHDTLILTRETYPVREEFLYTTNGGKNWEVYVEGRLPNPTGRILGTSAFEFTGRMFYYKNAWDTAISWYTMQLSRSVGVNNWMLGAPGQNRLFSYKEYEVDFYDRFPIYRYDLIDSVRVTKYIRGCKDHVVKLSVQNVQNRTTYRWSLPGDTWTAQGPEVPLQLHESGAYIVEAAKGIYKTYDTVYVTVDNAPAVEMRDTSVCAGLPVILSPVSSDDSSVYEWRGADGVVVSNTYSYQATFNQPTLLVVHATLPNGCSSFDSCLVSIDRSNPVEVRFRIDAPDTVTPGESLRVPLLAASALPLRRVHLRTSLRTSAGLLNSNQGRIEDGASIVEIDTTMDLDTSGRVVAVIDYTVLRSSESVVDIQSVQSVAENSGICARIAEDTTTVSTGLSCGSQFFSGIEIGVSPIQFLISRDDDVIELHSTEELVVRNILGAAPQEASINITKSGNIFITRLRSLVSGVYFACINSQNQHYCVPFTICK